MHSLIPSFIHSSILLIVDSFIRSFIQWLIHSLIHSLMRWFLHAFIHSVTHSFIHLFLDSLILSIPSVISVSLFLQKKINCLIISSEKMLFFCLKKSGGTLATSLSSLCIFISSEKNQAPQKFRATKMLRFVLKK